MKELQTLNLLIDSFSKLPGVGAKSAERMAYAVLNMRLEDAEQFSNAIIDAATKIHKCPECGLYAEDDLCEICRDPKRDHNTICVVSEAKDVISIEKMNSYNGLFHVLGGTLNASKGIGADSLNINKLLERITSNNVKEVIIATNPTLDGETTALFLAKVLERYNVEVTRLGFGLAMGSNLEYVDSLTMSKAFEGRRKI